MSDKSIGNNASSLPILEVPGNSRWKDIAPYVKVSLGYWTKLGKLGKAPRGRKLSSRMCVYSNADVRRWLENPDGYHSED